MAHIEKQRAEITAYTQRIQNAKDAAGRTALQREMRNYVRASNVALQEKVRVMKAEHDAEAR